MLHSMSLLPGVLVAVLMIKSAFARPAAFIVEKASLRILSPFPRVYDTALANFGTPLYGASLLGELVYSADDALGCTPFADLPRAKGVGHATIALVDRLVLLRRESFTRPTRGGASGSRRRRRRGAPPDDGGPGR